MPKFLVAAASGNRSVGVHGRTSPDQVSEQTAVMLIESIRFSIKATVTCRRVIGIFDDAPAAYWLFAIGPDNAV